MSTFSAGARAVSFLELNEAGVSAAGDDDVVDLVIGVAAGDVTVEEIAADLRRLHKDG